MVFLRSWIISANMSHISGLSQAGQKKQGTIGVKSFHLNTLHGLEYEKTA